MSSDPKRGERDYYLRIGREGIEHSLGKPFSDDQCGQHLAAMSAFFSLMQPPPRRIVEFGCGTGWLSLSFAKRGYQVLGVDIAEEAVGHARAAAKSAGLANVEFLAADYESFAGSNGFDYAIFHDALHHAESELAALGCAHAALVPGGCLIALEPGSGHSAAASSREAVARYAVHEKDVPPASIVALGRRVGFQRHLVLPHPWQLHRRFYRRAYHRAARQSEATGLGWLSRLRSIFQLSRPRFDPGLVLLWK